MTSTRCSPSASLPVRSVWTAPRRVADLETSRPSRTHWTVLPPLTVKASCASDSGPTRTPAGPDASSEGANSLSPATSATTVTAATTRSAATATSPRRDVGTVSRGRRAADEAAAGSVRPRPFPRCTLLARSTARAGRPFSSTATIARAADRSAATAPFRDADCAHFNAAARPPSSAASLPAATTAAATAARPSGVSALPPSPAHQRRRCKPASSIAARVAGLVDRRHDAVGYPAPRIGRSEDDLAQRLPHGRPIPRIVLHPARSRASIATAGSRARPRAGGSCSPSTATRRSPAAPCRRWAPTIRSGGRGLESLSLP
jgi:hypothetical protein